MKVETTRLLREQFASENNFNKFVNDFTNWKESGKDSFFFGRDGGYRNPRLDNEKYLMHVHTVPAGNKEAMHHWNNNKSEKRSDCALVYVQRGSDYLLIYQFKHNAHLVPDMTNERDKTFMLKLAKIANDYLDYNDITEQLKLFERLIFE